MLITEAHKEDIQGTRSCYDRIIIRGTAGKFGYAGGMTSFFMIVGIGYSTLQAYSCR